LIEKREPKTREESNEELYSVTRYMYDNNKNLTEEHTSSTNIIRYKYDSMDRVVNIEDTTWSKIEYEYDKRGNRTIERIKVSDGVDKVIRTTYDKANRVIEKREATKEQDYYGEGRATEITLYEYDKVGNVVKEVDVNGNEILREYNALNKEIKIKDAEGSTRRKYYNNEGMLIKEVLPEEQDNFIKNKYHTK
jgi:YD repeat-containing protein